MGLLDKFGESITDVALGKLKAHLKKNDENVKGYFVTYNTTTDDLNIKKVYGGDVFLKKEEFDNIKKMLTNGK